MPWASGDHTIWPTPSFWHSGTTSASMTRQIREYWGWFETMRSKPISSARRNASSICVGRPLRDADVVHLALADEVVEGPHRLLQRGLVVEPVGLEQVDVVGLQPLQRGME